jgi:hypothetical protein
MVLSKRHSCICLDLDIERVGLLLLFSAFCKHCRLRVPGPVWEAIWWRIVLINVDLSKSSELARREAGAEIPDWTRLTLGLTWTWRIRLLLEIRQS